jgi:hypothetical protein
MLFNQFIYIIGFIVCLLILLWIKRDKLGYIIILLLIINLLMITLGVGKLLIYGSMRLDSFTHDMNYQVVNLKDNNTSISNGKSILNRLKSLNRKLSGKEPFYITKGGYQISVDSFGNEKSINIDKHF